MILQVVSLLKKNEIVCFPTETVYALACSAKNDFVISKIYSIKNRPITKQMSLLMKDINQVSMFSHLKEQDLKIIQHLPKGKITFVLPLHNRHYLPKKFFKDTIGIRISDHPTASKILHLFKSPIIATSVNITGSCSTSKASNIPDIIKKNISIIIKDDTLVSGIESTVIDLMSYKILRSGIVPDKEIYNIFQNIL
ncbi:threonylcarbamoyl-AMP synthase [Neoehrlichia mikurensis]|uniref:Threonylcarbamoyl-AMP synthase n=1 Tax=Neoehrlichia mikurensis TaxID=89586 RepID=A0A9Q9F3A3_9RICK|nr:L-threonylcarbamoyladenylate synthase [Neoehrlichia mikurensis]QXK92082.1 threonylcarbamoyl-AMP synthase [Neoehrlichia mikurensis]QXK92539.1 threonylcarbamoyl-AMP synthase [Neoehrlichia mikurensis]QXK93775.1 threonylcarbamoyl-AMP synthase [Neoehrlichia mikurensis]UTO55249.1 threonylcarbamoyl-AMP synthase [Neoehrlichia mikurensis]UTO56170.1 threonylcarbamoyl-AMP synthase [Neoehrlichia mikurensis]